VNLWHRPNHYPPVRRRVDELELHLMRCRRRNESACVMVAHVERGTRPYELLAHLRLTDSARIVTTLHGDELACVLDADGLDQGGLEARLKAAMPGREIRFGWSRFPEDGAALDVLLHEARAGLPRPADRLSAGSAGAVAPVEARAK
jgi:hypothetical protein